MSPHFPKTRRALLAAVPVAAVGAAAAGVTTRSERPASPFDLTAAGPSTRVTLARQVGGDSSAEVSLESRLHRVKYGWRTGAMKTTGFNMAAVTWPRGQKTPDIRIRVRAEDGEWEDWKVLPRQADIADASESGGRLGTDLVWVGRNKDVEIGFLGDRRPKGVRLTLINTVVTAADRAIPDDPPERDLDRASRAPKPWIRSRFDWNANNSLNNGFAGWCWTVKQVHIHHTAGSNSYSKADVPGMLRGIHRYHTQSLGWSDVGYNYLVDKWGRAWVGRRSPDHEKAVKGAHTLGFNHMSVGIAVIGNYQNVAPSSAVLEMIVKISAWKLDKYGRNPTGTVLVKSTGSDRYRAGKVLRMPVMNGHRDTNWTACPGAKLYAKLPYIRRRTRERCVRYS